MLFCLFPSLSIVQIKNSTAPIQLSTQNAGEIFWFEAKSSDYEKYFLKDLLLTKISDSRYLGAISLYSEEFVFISGFSNIQKRFLNHPTQNVLTSPIKIHTKRLDNPSSIRIPATFFNELEKIEKSQIDSEKALIRTSILKDTGVDSVCMETQLPVNSVRTSKFGSYRRLPTGLQYFHTGLDLRAAIGTPVYAMADGEVTLAQKFVVAGNAVILDHGNTLFSKYYHLSELLVMPGQKIKKGDLLGKAGGTGRVEAPHLHWEVSWKGIPADPVVFMETVKTICL